MVSLVVDSLPKLKPEDKSSRMLTRLPEDVLIQIITYLAADGYRALDATCRKFDECKVCGVIRCGRPKDHRSNASPGPHFRKGLLWRAAQLFYHLPLYTLGPHCLDEPGLHPIISPGHYKNPVAAEWYRRHWEGERFPSGNHNFSQVSDFWLRAKIIQAIEKDITREIETTFPCIYRSILKNATANPPTFPPTFPHRRRLEYCLIRSQPPEFDAGHEKSYI